MIKIYFKKTRKLLQLFMLLPLFTFAQIDLVQTTNNVITTATLVCASDNITSQNDFARLYNLSSLGYSKFEVTKVSFAVHGFQLGTAADFPVTVKVYASTGGTADANLTLKGEATVNITSAMVGTIVEVPLETLAEVTSAAMLIVVSAPNGQPTSSGFFPGGNSNGQTAPGYIKAAGCGSPNFTSYNDVGGANQHLILFPTGNPTTICPAGNVTLATQAQVNQFIVDYPNCTQIAGNLFIGNQAATSDITDLSPLHNIATVSGYAAIINISATNLNGLNNLTSVGTSLYVDLNSSLTNVDGLSNLKTVGTDFDIDTNPALTNVAGFGNLESIGEYFLISRNPSLTNLNGFGKLISVGTYFDIENNNSLTSLNGLSSLATIGQNIYIDHNPALTDISILQNTTFNPDHGMGLTITNNSALAVCNLPNFCTYIANPPDTYPRNISGNLANCLDEAAVIAACGTLSVEDINKTNINFYPNPVKETLYFSEKVSNVKITDVSGRTVKHISATGKSVNVANLAKGTYIISAVTKSGETVSKKIIKE